MARDFNRQVQTIGDIDIHSLIYDIKKPLVHISAKSPSTIISLRDSYLMQKKNSDVYDIFSKGVRQLNARLGSTIVPHRSTKRYYLND